VVDGTVYGWSHHNAVYALSAADGTEQQRIVTATDCLPRTLTTCHV